MTDVPDEDTVRRRRRTFAGGSEPDTVPVDGSTVIARRESRRRSTRESAGAHGVRPAPAPAESGRTAAAPGAASAAVYGARPADPVVAVRTAPPAHPRQEPIDGAAAAAAERRRARRTALIVVLAASAIAVGATAALLSVVLSP